MLIRKSLVVALVGAFALMWMPHASAQESQQAPPSVHVPQSSQSAASQTQVPAAGTQVPAILAGAAKRGTTPAPATRPGFRLPTMNESALKNRTFEPISSPASAAAMQTQDSPAKAGNPAYQTPRVDPESIRRHEQRVQQRLQAIRKQLQAEAAGSPAADSSTQVGGVQRNTPAPQTGEASATTFVAPKPNSSVRQEPATAGGSQTNNAVTLRQSTDIATASNANTAPGTNVQASLVNGPLSSPVRQVSANSFSRFDDTQPSIAMSAPAVEVQAFGPRTVGINKVANYRVTVRNLGNVDATKILVGVDLPEWVDLINVSQTNGSKKTNKGGGEDARLVWTVEKIPAGGSQTLSIEATPRKAEMFDLGVEWTYIPRNAMASVEVTQPRLDMKISGPRDVLYGEKAIYHVTVRNPGTGAAENVHVMLPEALGGERAKLDTIEPGKEKNFQVELLARTAGELDLIATATADGELKVSASRPIVVRRAKLGVSIVGPGMKYAGGQGSYNVEVANSGDAIAQDVMAAVALPLGVKYLAGIEAAKAIEGGVRWNVGTLAPGDKRVYTFQCELNSSGDLQMEAGARGAGDLAASDACVTKVDTIADLVLAVHDPKGPLPVGQEVIYKIHARNRGTRAAKGVQIVMQFSEGIEPTKGDEHKHQVVPGQVVFAPIEQIEPGQEIVFSVTAKASQAGARIFRAQLVCEDADSREMAEGTTRFFGESQPSASRTANKPVDNSFAPIRK